MLRFVLRKMLNKKYMILSLLLGNIFLISIAMSGPMYTRAVTQNLLTRTLEDSYAQTGVYPMLFTLDTSVNAGPKDSAKAVEYELAASRVKSISEELNTEEKYFVEFSRVEDFSAARLDSRSDQSTSAKFTIATLTDLDERADIISGSGWSSEPDADGVYDALIGRSAFIRKQFILGEVFEFGYIKAPDGNPLKIRISGVFTSNSDDRWINDESWYASEIFISDELFRSVFTGAEEYPCSINSTFYSFIDYEKLKSDNVEKTLELINRYNNEYNRVYIINFTASCESLLRSYRSEANRAAATLNVLRVPIFALLIAFIFMLSRQTLEIEQSEISVLKSRGASTGQILNIYLLQSITLALAALLISVPFSAFLCRAIGSANAFLRFVSRASLKIEYTKEVAVYAVAGAVVSVLAMILPAISFSRLTIVDAKRGRQDYSRKPVWQKFFIDIILLAVSLYGLYTFNNQSALLEEKAASGAALDPLIYMASSLFAVGASLFMVRIIPSIAGIIFRLFSKSLSPAMYASFLQVLRSRHNQAFIMVFLMLTIAVGILNADTASTVNTLKERQLRYNLGADVILEEQWVKTGGEYTETDAARYSEIDGVSSISKVYIDENGGISSGNINLSNVKVMGIDTRSFGLTAYMPDGLLPTHFYNYLNAISRDRAYVLCSSAFRDNLGLEIGDTVTLKTAGQYSMQVQIAEFIDYFPGYNAQVYETREDGTVSRVSRYLIVANLGYIQSYTGLQPYQLWLKCPESADSVYEYANSSGKRYSYFNDVYASVDTLKNEPSIQGTNGILTLSFIIGLTICAVGFLIFWILAIQSRTLQFGIYRAMGMSVKEIILMLINEHIWQSLMSVAAGTGIGYLVSYLYIPLIQIAYSSADASLPLIVTRDYTDHIRLIVIILTVLCVCVAALINIVRRLNVSSALKLGEE